MGRIGLVACAALLAACQRRVPESAPPPPSARAALDSAAIERLCAKPDLVRAGLADCELHYRAPHPAR